jgi:hypothetical protein
LPDTATSACWTRFAELLVSQGATSGTLARPEKLKVSAWELVELFTATTTMRLSEELT